MISEWQSKAGSNKRNRCSYKEPRLLLSAGGAGANPVTDAQLAAIALRVGGTVHSCDQRMQRSAIEEIILAKMFGPPRLILKTTPALYSAGVT